MSVEPNGDKPEPSRFNELNRRLLFGNLLYQWLTGHSKKFSAHFEHDSIQNLLKAITSIILAHFRHFSSL